MSNPVVHPAIARPAALPLGEVAQLELLTQINVDDLISALGLERLRTGRRALERLFRPAGLRFARQVAIYDAIVGMAGLQAGHTWLLEQFVRSVEVSGLRHIPRSGPLLIVANHPGQTDGSALLAAIPRHDLRVVSANHPFMRALPYTSRYLFFLADARAGQLGLIRATARHLRAGGAVLLFPGGDIEPDPALLPGAVDALRDWSSSVDLFARLLPEVTIVPALVRGVLASRAVHHPLTLVRRDPKERRRLAAVLQILIPAYHNVDVRLAFGEPIHAPEMWPGGVADTSRIVQAAMRGLIEQAAR
jgi:1-acyl-sn-glycerol-3-phosphate acyltransferase